VSGIQVIMLDMEPCANLVVLVRKRRLRNLMISRMGSRQKNDSSIPVSITPSWFCPTICVGILALRAGGSAVCM
jgi:hypothetical protein